MPLTEKQLERFCEGGNIGIGLSWMHRNGNVGIGERAKKAL